MIYLLYLLFLAGFDFIRKNLREDLSREQFLLKKLTKGDFSKTEAAALWTRIGDHKWYISEKLGRDVGVNVAAIDYLENIYQLEKNAASNGKFRNSQAEDFAGLSLA